MNTNDEGIALLKDYEKFAKVTGDPNVAHAYWDTVGKVWTLAWGFTFVDGLPVREGDTMTRAQADTRLIEELVPYEFAVEAACTMPPNENQFSALVVCAWNIGIKGLQGSSMIKAHNRGEFSAAARAFGLWNKAAGKTIVGLTRRRAAEAALYLKPVPGEALAPMPQKVDAEKSLLKSPIINGSTLAGTVTTIAVVADGADSVRKIKDSLGDMLPWVIVIGAVAATLYVVWQRVLQRRSGAV